MVCLFTGQVTLVQEMDQKIVIQKIHLKKAMLRFDIFEYLYCVSYFVE